MVTRQEMYTREQAQRAFEEMDQDQDSYVSLTNTLSEVALFVCKRVIPDRHTASEDPEDIAVVETAREVVATHLHRLIADSFQDLMHLARDSGRNAERALYLAQLYQDQQQHQAPRA